MRSRLIAILLAPAALVTVGARAEPPLPALVVTRSAHALDCPDAAQLAAEVARLNGRPTLDASGGAGTIRLHVELDRDAAGYHAVIRALGARSGERRLTDAGPSCGNLAEALALTLAIILDAREAPNAGDRSIEPRPATQIVVVGAEPGFERRFSERNAANRSGNATDVAAGIGLHAGALARAGLLFVGVGRVTLGEFLSLEAGGFFADGQTVPRDSGGELDLQLAGGFLGVCTRLATDRSRLALTLCAEPYLGRIRGTGRGFDQDLTRDHLWLAGGLALDADGAIAGPVRWHLRGAGLVVKKQRFTVTVVDEEPDPIFESSTAALLAAVGVRLHFE